MAVRHKHADAIIAWANGAKIEVYDRHIGWTDCAPNWHPNNVYRIKPEAEDVWRPSSPSELRFVKRIVGEEVGGVMGTGVQPVQKIICNKMVRILQQLMVNQNAEYKWIDVPTLEEEV